MKNAVAIGALGRDFEVEGEDRRRIVADLAHEAFRAANLSSAP